jgi:methylated-DNA-[protein]-cysteine S-methyltransferase
VIRHYFTNKIDTIGLICKNLSIIKLVMPMKKETIKSTPYGPVVITWIEWNETVKVTRVFLSDSSESALKKIANVYPMAHEVSCGEIKSVATDILRLLEGEPVVFNLDIADLDKCGRFQQRVLRAEHGIPGGRVSTYKLIASHLGMPKGARAVGNALANNPFPLIIPCHRAVRSDLTLGGYQGGLAMKRDLLTGEGITFDDYGRVKCLHFYYEKDTRK